MLSVCEHHVLMPNYRRVVYALSRRTVTVVDCHTAADMLGAYSDLDPFQSHWWQLSLREAAVRLRDSDLQPRTAA